MTLTADNGAVEVTFAPSDEALATPYDIAIQRTVNETGCTRDEATAMLVWVTGIVQEIRGWNDKSDTTYHPNDRDMATPAYDLFDRIMPHGKTARAGSAHEAIQDAVLDRSLGEHTLLHDDTGTAKRRDCNVTVGYETFDVS